MCSSSPPPPPPPLQQAAIQQGSENIGAAVASSNLNNPNVINPYGTQTYTEGAPAERDINTGALITPPGRPTMTQTFTPEQQALLDQRLTTQLGLSQLAQRGTGAAQNVLGTAVDYSGQPAAPGSAQATRDKVVNAMMGRVNEDYARSRDQANSDLIAAGIRPGSKAYDDRMALMERGLTDARQQAILAGGQEASRDFAMDTERRRSAIGEYLSQRQVPLNEIAALMSGSQVQNPFAMPSYAQNAQVQPAPLYAAQQGLADYQTDVYNAQQAQQAGLQSGLFGLGGAGLLALGMSDRRLKSNIMCIGTHPELGIGIYEYDLFGHHDYGVMADEVLIVRPSAVFVHPTGYLMVDYAQLGGRL